MRADNSGDPGGAGARPGLARLGSPRRCGAGASLCSPAAGRGRAGEAEREAGGRPGVGLGRASPEGVGWIFVLFLLLLSLLIFLVFRGEEWGGRQGSSVRRKRPRTPSPPRPPVIAFPLPGALRGSPPMPRCLSPAPRTDSPPLSLSLQHVEDPGINIPDQTVIKKGEPLPRAWWQSLGAAGRGLGGRAGQPGSALPWKCPTKPSRCSGASASGSLPSSAQSIDV